MTGFDRATRDAGRVHHPIQARFALRAQLHPILKQRPQQLATLGLQAILELGVLKPIRLLAAKPLDHPLKPLPGTGKRIPISELAGRGSAGVLKIRCTIPTGRA
jgi:hypothetical protein